MRRKWALKAVCEMHRSCIWRRAVRPDQSGERDCFAPFIEGAFNVQPGKGQLVNEVMRLEVYDDEYEDDCVIQKKHFVYLPSVKFMGAFNMRMMMSMVDAQYN